MGGMRVCATLFANNFAPLGYFHDLTDRNRTATVPVKCPQNHRVLFVYFFNYNDAHSI